MGSFSLMSIGSRAMTANYTALQTSGHNISNASVEGYSRQTVEFATSAPQFTGGGYVGMGVDLQTISRAHNDFLAREANATASAAQSDGARLDLLKKMEAIFVPGVGGLGYTAGQLLNSFGDLASQPSDLSARQSVLARAQEFADRYRIAAQQLQTLQSDISSQVNDALTQVNGLAASVAELNKQIIAGEALGQPPNDLLDARDQLIKKLSDFVQVTVIDQDDGSKSLFIAGGQMLVSGAQSSSLLMQPDRFDPDHRIALAINRSGAVRDLEASTLGGGKLAGWLAFQNDDLVQGQALLGQLALAVAGAVNQQQALGLDAAGRQGENIFEFGERQLFGVADDGLQQAVLADTANPVKTVKPDVTIADYSQLIATEYRLSFDRDADMWLLSRMAGGQPSEFSRTYLGKTSLPAPPLNSTPVLAREVGSSPVYEIDGLRIDLSALSGALDNQYLIQPVTYAALNLRGALDDFRGLAAASPVTAQAGSTNTGTATMAALNITDPQWVEQMGPDFSLTLSFETNNSWEIQSSNWDGIDSSQVPPSVAWVAGQDVVFGGLSFRLNGVPQAGDTFTITRTTAIAQNNGNALAMLGLRDEGLVGRKVASDGTVIQGATFTDAYASALADVGVRVQGASASTDVSTAIADLAEQRRAGDVGVNLDEEAARLLQYQQSYQAAAKILQVAQTIFDTLLRTTAT